MDGIICLNKERGMTSNRAVQLVKKKFPGKKIGHAGTLDPLATGVLPIMIGRGTRIMEYLDSDLKTYRCTMDPGFLTDTLDMEGEVTEEFDAAASGITEDSARSAIAGFLGVIEQVPPVYSALKFQGKKLYEYARAGKDVPVKSRRVFIESIELTDFRKGGTGVLIDFEVTCSKGTYIRSLARDIGAAMGLGGTMTALERTASGIFRIEQSVAPEELETLSSEELEKKVIPCDEPLKPLGACYLNKDNALRFSVGLPVWSSLGRFEEKPRYMEEEFPLDLPEIFKSGYRVYLGTPSRRMFLGIAALDEEEGMIRARKVFVDGGKDIEDFDFDRTNQ